MTYYEASVGEHIEHDFAGTYIEHIEGMEGSFIDFCATTDYANILIMSDFSSTHHFIA